MRFDKEEGLIIVPEDNVISEEESIVEEEVDFVLKTTIAHKTWTCKKKW